jgi:hypothetical protein
VHTSWVVKSPTFSVQYSPSFSRYKSEIGIKKRMQLQDVFSLLCAVGTEKLVNPQDRLFRNGSKHAGGSENFYSFIEYKTAGQN